MKKVKEKKGYIRCCKRGQHYLQVAGNLIKSVADTVDKLQDLNKKLKDLKELPKTANANIKNVTFVGSTVNYKIMLKKDEVIEGKAETSKEDDISDK